MNKMMIDVKGEKIEVMEAVFGTCPKCKNDTFAENEYVYADDQYAVEICPNCGWWANSIANSDAEETEEFVAVETSQCFNPCERLSIMIDRFYGEMYYNTYGFEFDEDDAIKANVLKEAFNKACYDLDVKDKSFVEELVCDEPYLKIVNFIMVAAVPVENGDVAIFSETLTDYCHSCPSHIMEG